MPLEAPIFHLPQEIVLRVADILLLDSEIDPVLKCVEYGDYDDLETLERYPLLPGPGSRDVRNLAFSCQTFYRLLCSKISSCITLRNKEASSKAISHLLDSDLASFVLTVRIDASLEGTRGESASYATSASPLIYTNTLRKLKRCINLNTVILSINGQRLPATIYWLIKARADDHGCRPDPKADVEWEKLQDHTWSALVDGTPHTVRRFLLRTSPLGRIPALSSGRMHKILNELETFDVKIYGRDEEIDCMECDVATTPVFTEFASGLVPNFIQHLANVTRLWICGSYDAFVGTRVEGEFDGRLDLGPQHMPQLRDLVLDWFCIWPNFLNFLSSRGDTLENVEFRNCWIVWDSYTPIPDKFPDHALSWGKFFRQWADMRSTALKKVSFTGDGEADGLGNTITRRRYVRITDDNWSVYGREEHEEEPKSQETEDFEGWQQLMAIVASNRDKLSKHDA